MGLCVLFTGCSTTGDYMQTSNLSTADKGARYLLGRGVPRNDAKAFDYFSEAARANDPFAQNELAYMYASGEGTPRNYERALMWYKKAADHDLASAQYNLGLMYLHGLGTTPNKALALRWFQKSASHQFEPAKQALLQYKS